MLRTIYERATSRGALRSKWSTITDSLPAYYPISRPWNKYREEFINVREELKNSWMSHHPDHSSRDLQRYSIRHITV